MAITHEAGGDLGMYIFTRAYKLSCLAAQDSSIFWPGRANLAPGSPSSCVIKYICHSYYCLCDWTKDIFAYTSAFVAHSSWWAQGKICSVSHSKMPSNSAYLLIKFVIQLQHIYISIVRMSSKLQL